MDEQLNAQKGVNKLILENKDLANLLYSIAIAETTNNLL